MSQLITRFRFRLSLLPLLGIGVFVGLYGWATVLYPGGSNADHAAMEWLILPRP